MPRELTHILYVEDDESIAEVTKMTLEMVGGFTVTHASSGIKALDIINSGTKVDLILMDMMMPEMDGLETMKLIHKKSNSKVPPVIFMTAKAQVHEQEEYINSGAIGVIVKPFNPATLCDEIKEFWDSLA